MIKNIIVPTYIIDGINNKVKKFPKYYKFWGADFETVNGEPYSLQICENGKDAKLIWVNKKNVLHKFISYFKKHIVKHKLNVVYFHNLNFDLSVLLYQFHKEFLGHISLETEVDGVEIEAVLGSITFAKFTFSYEEKNSKGMTVLWVLDSLSFMSGGSLKFWAEKLHLPFKKLPVPKGIGEKKLKSKKFINYAKQDCIVQWHLASWILDRHKEYNVAPCVSSAQFSMRVFRSSFFKKDTLIPYIPKRALEGCVLSYHGGRNGFYVDRPTLFKNCAEVDISSAYPYAMTKLPNFNHCSYKRTKELKNGIEGIYQITGIYLGCKYPVIFTHNFKEIEKNSIFKIWVTSYELRAVIKEKSVKDLKILDGYIIEESNEEKYKYNPFKDFVNTFYNKKETSDNFQQRLMYKIILNSLYGKFIQTTLDDDNVLEEEEKPKEPTISLEADGSIKLLNDNAGNKEYIAGGMFNLMIATLITGYTRVYLHRLEHKYQAIHSSTDSIKCNAKRLEKDLPKGLGTYKLECVGDCLILRNKLYLHYNEKGEIKKFALHGFSGKKEQLLELVTNKKNTYKVNRMLKVREAYKQQLKPLMMTEQDKILDIDLSVIDVKEDY